MHTRDIIVIGGSAGSLPSFKEIILNLAPDSPGALFFVRHFNADMHWDSRGVPWDCP